MILRVGDVVKIRSDLVQGKSYGPRKIPFYKPMIKYSGCSAKISQSFCFLLGSALIPTPIFHLDIDQGIHYWCEEMFEDESTCDPDSSEEKTVRCCNSVSCIL